jgi:hypothetical protein
MTNNLLRTIGEQLYGPRWQTDLSRDISVSDRTMRRWTSGEDDVPEGAWRDIYHRLDNRVTDLDRTKYRLSGLIGARAMTLQPIPNSEAKADIYGVEFAMRTETGGIVRCLARREFFDDRSCLTSSVKVAFFNRHACSFHVAASVKYDMREFTGDMIVIGNDDIILLSLPPAGL